MSFQHSIMWFIYCAILYIFVFFRYILKRDNLWSKEKVVKEVMSSNVFNENELVRLISRTIFDNFLMNAMHFFVSAVALIMLQMMVYPIPKSGFIKISILLAVQILVLMIAVLLVMRKERRQLEQLFSKDTVRQILNEKKAVASKISLKEEFPVPNIAYAFLAVQQGAFLVAVWFSFKTVFFTGIIVCFTGMVALIFLDRIPFNYQFAEQVEPFREILGNVKKKAVWIISMMSLLAYLTLWLAGSYYGG